MKLPCHLNPLQRRIQPRGHWNGAETKGRVFTAAAGPRWPPPRAPGPAKIQPGIGEEQAGSRHPEHPRTRGVVHPHPEPYPTLKQPQPPPPGKRPPPPAGGKASGSTSRKGNCWRGEQSAFPTSRLNTFKTAGSKRCRMPSHRAQTSKGTTSSLPRQTSRWRFSVQHRTEFKAIMPTRGRGLRLQPPMRSVKPIPRTRAHLPRESLSCPRAAPAPRCGGCVPAGSKPCYYSIYFWKQF